MKLQQTPNFNAQKQNIKTNNSSIAFKGADTVASALMFLDNNAAWGASAVDLFSMVLPRTAVDYTRGVQAGNETAIREFSSLINDGLLGAYGVGAAYLLAKGMNNAYGVKAHNMFVDDNMIEGLSKLRGKHGDIKTSDDKLKKYLGEIIDQSRGFSPDMKGADKSGWVGVKDNKVKKAFVDRMASEIKNGPDKMTKESREYLKSLLVKTTDAESRFKINGIDSENSAGEFVENIYKVSKTFMSEKVAKTFNGGNITDNAFVKSLKGLNAKTAIAGTAFCTAIGMAVQPLNVYLTKKRTGKSGFVGVEGREQDNSNGFKALKVGVAALGTLGTLFSITKGKITLGGIMKKIQFKGVAPTLDQFKLVYGATIISRMLASRDKNELRETTFKDSLGFVNWLIMGGFASKLVAIGCEKLPKFKQAGEKFLKYNSLDSSNAKGKISPKAISGTIVTREEVLHDALKKANIDVIKGNKAMTFSEMFKAAPKFAQTKVKYLGMIQLAGYLFSGVVLGYGIPKLNIAMTNAIEKNKQKDQPVKA